MGAENSLEFVNRKEELSYIEQCLMNDSESPTLIIVRSPTGYGKSSLTDQVCKVKSISGRSICIVDPDIRGAIGSITNYNGYFLQRIADSLNQMADTKEYDWPSLLSFLKERKKILASRKDGIDIFSELPSLKHLYKVVYDYTARAFSFGKYSPDKLLKSDESSAISLCSSYAEYVLQSHKVILILREAQHFDSLSLKNLLINSESNFKADLIFEYTCHENSFAPIHHDLFIKHSSKRPINMLELTQLKRNHLEYLIKKYIKPDINLSSESYLTWDGNLRSIIEMRFQVSIGQKILNGDSIGARLTNLTDTISEHLNQLNSLEKLILAIILSNIEPIEQQVIISVVMMVRTHERQSEILKALDALEKHHIFITRKFGTVSVENSSIAEAQLKVPSMKGLCAISEKTLRDFYSKLLQQSSSKTNYYNAVRQYFRLCAKTYDTQGIQWAIQHLHDEIKNSQDQSIYIEAVSSAIEDAPELYKNDYVEVIDWVAELAYSTSDWGKVVNLLEIKGHKKSNYDNLMYACSLQEIGKHDQAIDIIYSLRLKSSLSEDELIATKLIEALIVGCKGEHSKSSLLLDEITSSIEHKNSPLKGYAYRFYEIQDSMGSSLEYLNKSIAHFDASNLKTSKAYSQLAVAMLMARTGRVQEAREIILQANYHLACEVGNQYMALNNSAAVELLSSEPDFNTCIELLNQALKSAYDDYSELTILINLSLAYSGCDKLDLASHCVDKSMKILENHDFSDTGIYWPSYFNISTIYNKCGEFDKEKAALSYPFNNKIRKCKDAQYWDYRYGLSNDIPKSHQYLCAKEWHPLYLSHWLIDLEGLLTLKKAQLQ